MTISVTSIRATFQGNGAATSFSFGFPIQTATDITAYYVDSSSNVVTLSASAYTVSGVGNQNGGSVTYPTSGSAIATGTELVIVREVPYNQLADLSSQGDFFPEVYEAALDKLTMQTQQLADAQARSFTIPGTYDPTSFSLSVTPAPNGVVAFDGSGSTLTTVQIGSLPGYVIGNGLTVSATTLSVKTGVGLSISAGAVIVNAGSRLTISGTTVALRGAGSDGILFGTGSNMSTVTLGAGLTMSGSTLSVSLSGNGLVLLSTITASNTSAIIINNVFTSLYDVYEIEIIDLVPTTDNVALNLRVSADNGTTSASGSTDYAFNYTFLASSVGGIANGQNNTGTAQIELATGVSNGTARSLYANIKFSKPSGIVKHKKLIWDGHYENNSANPLRLMGGGSYIGNTVSLSGLFIYMGSGSISAAVVHVYGRSTS